MNAYGTDQVEKHDGIQEIRNMLHADFFQNRKCVG